MSEPAHDSATDRKLPALDASSARREWSRVERALDLILDRGLDRSAATLADAVDRACGADTALRARVEALMAGASDAADLLKGSVLSSELVKRLQEELQAPEIDPLLGAQLGAWVLEQEVGSGGMARVYRASRADGNFRQTVAIKVLRAGLDSPADRERFRRERDALAALNHPNIARLLDAGVMADGRPYLALEFVDGEPLLAYVESRRLPIPARLALFTSVADAVAAAHRQLILHRDIKPANVLVEEGGIVRLLDFGISTLLDDRREASSTTRARWLTPAYAAPEQLRGERLAVTTDVYQLGALLYELLTGVQAFGADGVRGDPIETRVQRDDPTLPSLHCPALRGDLDAIILKAMRKSADARYASVAELLADVVRHQQRLPVHARAGSRWYRWRRLARRHAVALTVGASLTAVTVGYSVVVSSGRRAVQRALERATSERETADAVTSFMMALFRSADPEQVASDTLSARALVQRGVTRINALSSQPVVQAELLRVVGRLERSMGALDSSHRRYTRSLSLLRQHEPARVVTLAETMAELAEVDSERGEGGAAEAGYRQALALFREAGADTSGAAHSARHGLANLLHRRGDYARARVEFDRWANDVLRHPAGDDTVIAQQLLSLGEQADVVGDMPRAERLLAASLARFERAYGVEHAAPAEVRAVLGDAMWKQGRAAEGEAHFTKALQTFRALQHPDSIVLSYMMQRFADGLSTSGQHERAWALADSALEIKLSLGARTSLDVVSGLELMATLSRRSGALARSDSLLREVEQGYTRSLGARNAMVARARFNRGDVLWEMGRAVEGESLLVQTYREWVRERGASHQLSRYGLGLLRARLLLAGRVPDVARHDSALAATRDTGAAAGAGRAHE